MAQKILTDSGLLIDEGKTAAEYTSAPDWDPAVYQIVDTGQTFDPFVTDPVTSGRVPNRQTWFYLPSLNKFFQSTRKVHAIIAAAKSLFTVARWSEIEDIIEDQGPVRAFLDSLDLGKIRRKISRARAAGLITQAEVDALQALVAHLPNGL